VAYIYRKKEHNTRAAREVVPFLIELFKPKSVIDIGCGTGSWLSIFENCGIVDYCGIDASYVNKKILEIPQENFISADLENKINVEKKYDLLLCLEVAEHLTFQRSESFVCDLVNISDTIIFSAAIPHQTGQNHINEQYPEFWVKIFNKFNYECFDLLRPIIWNNNDVDWWYRQNILIFKKNISNETIKFKNINAIITHELYKRKLKEISNLQEKIYSIKKGDMRFSYYIKAIFKRLLKGIKRMVFQ